MARDAHALIARDVGKPVAEVARYAAVFWERGADSFPTGDWDKILRAVDKGEQRLEEIGRLVAAARRFVRRFDNP